MAFVTSLLKKSALIISILLTTVQYSDAKATQILPGGTTEISGVLKKKKIRIVLATIPVAAGINESCISIREFQAPRTSILKEIEIYIDGHPVFVPRSAFSDLNSPRGAMLHTAGRRFMLELRGGDGAETYGARIYFDSKRVSRRKVYDFIEDDGPVEDTQYFEHVL